MKRPVVNVPPLRSRAFPLSRPPLPQPAQSLPFNRLLSGLKLPQHHSHDLRQVHLHWNRLAYITAVHFHKPILESVNSTECGHYLWFSIWSYHYCMTVPNSAATGLKLLKGNRSRNILLLAFSGILHYTFVMLACTVHLPVRDERGEWGRGKPVDCPLPIRLFLVLVLQLWNHRVKH